MFKATAAGLVATTHGRPAAQQALDRVLVVGQRPLLRQLVGAHRRQTNRTRVHVQPHRYRGRRRPIVDRQWSAPGSILSKSARRSGDRDD
jgi:hypothetical protein